MKENWYENWFDSKYYHILYKNRNDDEARLFLDNLVQKLPMQYNSRAIDVGCGKGRHAIYLNSKGFEVQGIDLSKSSIRCAQEVENNTLSFNVHDMRLPFKEKYYDYALNLFTSFGYFDKDDDNLKTIQAISKMLKKKGLLVLDYLNSTKTRKEISKEDSNFLMVDGIEFTTQKIIQNSFVKKNIQIKDGAEIYNFVEEVKLLQLEDFLAYFDKAGMKLEKIYGDYDLSPFNQENSNRMILIASNT